MGIYESIDADGIDWGLGSDGITMMVTCCSFYHSSSSFDGQTCRKEENG